MRMFCKCLKCTRRLNRFHKGYNTGFSSIHDNFALVVFCPNTKIAKFLPVKVQLNEL